MSAFLKKTLGSPDTAASVAQRVQQVVPAYKHFLESQGLKIGEPFERLPQSDKKSYALAYPYEELLAGTTEEIFAIFRSSGSSGNSFYWPQLRSAYRHLPTAVKRLLEDVFAIHQKKTLAIIGFTLGGWIGGESTSWLLKNVAVDAPYPFWVFSPGNHPDEIIEITCQMNPFVDQIILLLVPSAIAHLHLRASQLHKSLPLAKLRYLVGGEPFPESIRTSLQERAGIAADTPFMLSTYASGDTGTLGYESLATVALRKLLDRNNALASCLGIESPIPQFLHFITTDTFLETVDGHLCVTRWQGIPLVRYILYDHVALYSWKELKQAILTSELLDSNDEPWVKILSAASDLLPDLIAVTGRADSCLILGGANLMEYMLDAAVKCEQLHGILTGLYRARIVYAEDGQYLAFDLETRQGVSPDPSLHDLVYHSLVQTLGRLETGFLENWKHLYSAWDNDPTKRVLRLNFLPWPSLSQATENSIKQRGIVQQSLATS